MTLLGKSLHNNLAIITRRQLRTVYEETVRFSLSGPEAGSSGRASRSPDVNRWMCKLLGPLHPRTKGLSLQLQRPGFFLCSLDVLSLLPTLLNMRGPEIRVFFPGTKLKDAWLCLAKVRLFFGSENLENCMISAGPIPVPKPKKSALGLHCVLFVVLVFSPRLILSCHKVAFSK